MSSRHTLAGLLLVAGTAMAMAGVSTGGTTPAHAGSPVLTIDSSVLDVNPLSLTTSGTGFTPGGRVHLDLYTAPITYAPTDDGSDGAPVPQVTPLPSIPVEGTPEIDGSADITAARTINVPNGHGIVFKRVGGYFTTTLTSLSPTCGPLDFWAVATDVATGVEYTTGKAFIDFPCS